MPGRQAHTSGQVRRATAVLLLVGIAAVGLRAGADFPTARSPGLANTAGQILYWTAVALWAVLVLLGVAVIAAWLFWARRGGPRPAPRKRKRGGIWWLLLLPLEVIALSRILEAIRHRTQAQALQSGHAAARPAAAHGWHLLFPPPSSWPLLTALTAAALAAALLAAPRRRSRGETVPPGPPAPGAGQAPLLAALDAGAGVLRDDPDPRTAIVNCYAAMEHSLAQAGSPPSAADTPAELLDRAAGGGLIRSGAAGTLTGLFRRARYSAHPVTETDRADALAAFAQLRAELGAPA